jgi:hypothetical protein
MPRPTNKEQLLEQSNSHYQRLNDYLSKYSPEQMEMNFPKEVLYQNVRDVLAHLHHWHKMLLEWYAVGATGAKPDMPAKGYSWKMTPELNRHIQKMYSNTPLEEAQKLLQESHKNTQSVIQKHSNDELFTKKRLPWTGSTSVGAYFVSACSSHYQWALKYLKKNGHTPKV